MNNSNFKIFLKNQLNRSDLNHKANIFIRYVDKENKTSEMTILDVNIFVQKEVYKKLKEEYFVVYFTLDKFTVKDPNYIKYINIYQIQNNQIKFIYTNHIKHGFLSKNNQNFMWTLFKGCDLPN